MQASAQASAMEPGAIQPQSEAQLPRRVLIVGGGLAGLAAARELRGRFRVTVVDAKEYFELTSGILRAYADPSHWDSLTFLYKDVLERVFGVGFIWGEVISIDGEQKFANVKTMFAKDEDVVPFDFCIIAGGCNFNPTLVSGESAWFPTIHQQNIDRSEAVHPHLDERFLEGRRRRILEEHHKLQQLNNGEDSSGNSVLIVGAGAYGVEWACELQHFFPKLQITICDFIPYLLLPLPPDAKEYCEDYLKSRGIRTVFNVKFDANRSDSKFWDKVGLKQGMAKVYVVSGVKQSNYFMPKNTLSDKGPSGGGWITHNQHLQVMTKDTPIKKGEVWAAHGVVFAVGDCIYGCIGEVKEDFKDGMPPVPKTGYTAEQQAIHCAQNVDILDRQLHGGSGRCFCLPMPGFLGRSSLRNTWYPWGSGMFAISLGPSDGCFIVGVNHLKDSGRIKYTGQIAAALKELIETTKVAQCRGEHSLSQLIWYTIHHWPLNLWGSGPMLSIAG